MYSRNKQPQGFLSVMKFVMWYCDGLFHIANWKAYSNICVTNEIMVVLHRLLYLVGSVTVSITHSNSLSDKTQVELVNQKKTCFVAEIIFVQRPQCLCYYWLSIYDTRNNVYTCASLLSALYSSSPYSPALACSLACMMSIHREQRITIIHGKRIPHSQTDRSKDVVDRWG